MENSNLPLEIQRNWLELPFDIILMILMKLSPLEILDSAQFVCKFLYNLCKDPSLWRTIHIRDVDVKDAVLNYEKMVLNAVDRSAGCLIDLNIENIGSNKLLSYVASRSSQLKRLRLARCLDMSAEEVTEALTKLTSLEELDLTVCSFQNGDETSSIIKSCPSLTTFKFNKVGSRNALMACDNEALAISGCMPELRHLQLIGNGLTNDGLTAILDGCPHLQSLDIRACFHLDLVGNLRKRLSEHIKDFRGPNDSTEDYNYCTSYSYIERDWGEVYTSDAYSDYGYSDWEDYDSDDDDDYIGSIDYLYD